MSMGYGARATLVLEDAETAIYTYGGFNWDIPSCKNPDYVQDGLLTIPRDCLPESEIHARWRRMPSGKKRWIEKRVPVMVDVCGMIREGRIRPELIIGVPVGFVNVVQAKELIMTADVPYIVAKGRKGGSNIAAAICNALLYMLDSSRGQH